MHVQRLSALKLITTAASQSLLRTRGGKTRGTWGLAGVPDQPSAVSLRGQGRFLTVDGKAPSGQRWSLFLIHGCGHLPWSGCQHLWPQVMPPPVLVIFKCYLTRTLKDLISWPEITSACFRDTGLLFVTVEAMQA